MASVFVHAALPLVARRLFPLPEGRERALAITAVLLATWPDLDLVTFVFERRPPDVLAHGGISHALWTAGMAAVLALAVVFRELRWGSRDWKRVLFYFASAACSHGLVDALTANEHGVALFAPFVDTRVASPWKLLPALQTGLQEALGFVGLLVVANELLYVVLPVAIAVMIVDARREDDRDKTHRAWRVGLVWLVCAVGLRVGMPAWFAPTMPRVLGAVGSPDAGDPQAIPRDGLPDEKVVTRLDELQARGLFDRTLEPAHPAWSSSFFPSWFGGEAGRWTDSTATLVWRTLNGFAPPTAAEAQSWRSSKERLFALAPTEKLDIALGHYDFPATRQALHHSHNKRPMPRYWSGRCNGVAAAAIATPEPHRVVEVIAKDGTTVPFHPNDVKSLLSVAYYQVPKTTLIGNVCDVVALDAGASCSMNPAVFVIAVTNRIGLARRSFLVDALPTIAKQYYAVASARVDLLGRPRPLGAEKTDATLAGRATAVQDVAITLVLSSTTLRYARANVRVNDGAYARVGVVPVEMKYRARLALDGNRELVGGMWTGDPPDGPDNVMIVDGEPELTGTQLAAADAIPWAVVHELARLSAADEGPSTLDLRPR